mmetsp:Transcript_6315/g.17126  ORF Transcript_6315/g.17126 Transcript_6315/m.17126 type:complete len:701 (+) Transcript_6315:393-2495(+)
MVPIQDLRPALKVHVPRHHVLRRRQRGLVILLRGAREVEVPPALLLAAVAAGGGAVAPLVPILPNAEHVFVAITWALANLLGVERAAALAAVHPVGHDLPEALALPSALGALAPRLPVAKLAVHRTGPAARAAAALLNLGSRRIAGFSSKHRVLQDVPVTDALSSVTAGTAVTPRSPLIKLAIDRFAVGADGWHLLVRRGVARLHHLQRAFARLALARPVALHAPGAPLDAIARCCAGTPIAPRSHLAIRALLTLCPHVAELHLGIRPSRLRATEVSRRHDFPLSERLSAAAGDGARRPVLPVGPPAVDAAGHVGAGLRVAGAHLLPVVGCACAAAAAWWAHDRAVAGPLSSAAGDGALAPLGPHAPLAVLPLARRVLPAIARLAQGVVAPVALAVAQPKDGAAAHLLAGATAGRAHAPRAPVAHLAVLVQARLRVAAPDLHQVCRAGPPAIRRELQHLPLAVGLPAAAGAVAERPRRPVGHLAVHRPPRAGRRLAQRGRAGPAAAGGLRGHGAVAGRLAQDARHPLLPVAQLAVHGIFAYLQLAMLHLGEGAREARGVAGGRAQQLPCPRLVALAAGPAAAAPLLPRAEAVRLALHGGLVAGPGLPQRPVALLASTSRRLQDLPGPLVLAVLAGGAVGPVGPAGEQAVLADLACHVALLCLQERSVARLATLVVQFRNNAVPLAKARAVVRVVMPLAPG